MSDCLRPHGLQHARLLCPPLPPRHSNSCSLNWWCHPTIVFSATLFSSYLQSSPATESFPMSRLFTSDGQNMGASASALILPMNIQCGFLLGLAGLISLLSKGLSRAFFSTTVWKHQFFGTPASLWTNTHICTWKTIILTRWTFVGKVMSLLLNMMSRFVIAFLPKSNRLLISWLQSWFAMILEPKKIKFVTASTFSFSICHEAMGPEAMIFVFGMLSFKPAFSLSTFIFKEPLSFSSFSAIRVVSSAYLKLLFLPAILIPACDSSSLAFHMVYSAYKLNKQGDNIQPCHTPFPILDHCNSSRNQ